MESAPERGVPRLFVGNLVPSIGDDALRRTLSRYGTVRSIERHPDFAHIGIVPADDTALDRCVAALHRTKWQGTELRVERALEHWANKLRREWDEQKETVLAARKPADDGLANDKTAPGMASRKVGIAAKFKGNRTLFNPEDEYDASICDDEDIMARFDDDDTVLLGRTPGLEHAILGGQVTDESETEGVVTACLTEYRNRAAEVANIDALPDTQEEQRSDAQVAEDADSDEAEKCDDASDCKIEAPYPVSLSPKEKPSAAVASTLELFGLADSPEPAAPAHRASKRGAEVERRDVAFSSNTKKRPRIEVIARDEGYDAAAIAAEADPTKMDGSRERALALGVLASLFPSEIIAAAPGRTAGVKELNRIASLLRRPALFRNLVVKSNASGYEKEKKVRPVPIRGAAKRFKQSSGKSSLELGRTSTGLVGDKRPSLSRNEEYPAKRAGLYRRLISRTKVLES
jgi:hypothetical protein